MKLEEWRHEIDQIDAELVRLIDRRARIARKIGTLKLKTGLPVVDAEREERVLRNIGTNDRVILEKSALVGIFRKILHESRKVQHGAGGGRGKRKESLY